MSGSDQTPADEAPQEEAPVEEQPAAEAEPSAEETPANISKIEEARKVLADIRKANKESREWIERAERLKANEILGGESEAGIRTPTKSKEEIEIDEAKEMLKNTGLDPFA